MSLDPVKESCPFASEAEDIAEIEPLTAASSRTDIHKRLVAPLASTVLINALDSLSEQGGNLSPRDPFLIENVRKNNPWYNPLDYAAVFSIFTAATQSDVGQLKKAVKDKVHHDSNWPRYDGNTFVTKEQEKMYDGFVANGHVVDYVYEGIQAQVNSTFNICLPAYLIAKHRLIHGNEVVDLLKQMTVTEVGNLIQSRSFMASMSRLAITANGLYKRSDSNYVDYPRTNPVIDVDNTVKTWRYIQSIDDVPEAVDIFELYEQKEDGTVRLSSRTLAALKFYMAYRNRIPEDARLGGVPGPSRGCPVVQTSVRMREDDLTDWQWNDLVGGDNPIASYDTGAQKLTFHRLAFHEMAKFIAERIKFDYSEAKTNIRLTYA